jgi:hypothetical protein
MGLHRAVRLLRSTPATVSTTVRVNIASDNLTRGCGSNLFKTILDLRLSMPSHERSDLCKRIVGDNSNLDKGQSLCLSLSVGTSQTLRDTSLAEIIERPLPERVQATLPGGWRGSLSVSSYPKPTLVVIKSLLALEHLTNNRLLTQFFIRAQVGKMDGLLNVYFMN